MGGSGPPWVPVSCGCTGEWTRTVTQLFDVSVAAQSGAISLQFQLSNSVPGYTGSATMQFSVFRFTMTPTASDFRPRDGREPLVANCAQFPDNCTPQYVAGFDGPPNPIAFTLSSPTACLNGLPQTACQNGVYLAGTSTNNGAPNPPGGGPQPPADDTTVPDYVFTQSSNPGFNPPTAGGLSIQTSGPVNSAMVTVTSQDYGGRALLTATTQLSVGTGQMMTVAADIFDPNSTLPPAQSVTIAGTCGPTGAPPYVNLPVDIDCDGIADWWEDMYSSPTPQQAAAFAAPCNSLSPLGHLQVTCDVEPGPSPGISPIGDGYSVHDEYRGFHYINDSGALPALWTGTDPLNISDVFFWDQSGKFTMPLRKILDKQTPAFQFRRVSAPQAHPKNNGTNPRGGTDPLNKYSITSASQQGFAVVYDKRALGRLGQLEELGQSLHSTNDGFPISIDSDAISSFGNNFPATVLLDEVVAHETGHHFGQRHPLSQTCCGNALLLPTNQLGSLTQDQFSLGGSPSSTLYIRLSQYLDTTSNVRRTGDGVDLSPFTGVAVRRETIQVPDPNAPVFLVTLMGTLTAPAKGLGKAIQRLKIMDWTPNLNLRMDNQWQFDAGFATNQGNLSDLCVTKVCHR
jgi:hypothetical protein